MITIRCSKADNISAKGYCKPIFSSTTHSTPPRGHVDPSESRMKHVSSVFLEVKR